jgi:hypothetical protein
MELVMKLMSGKGLLYLMNYIFYLLSSGLEFILWNYRTEMLGNKFTNT